MSPAEFLPLFYGFMVGVGVTFVWARGKLGDLEAKLERAHTSRDFWQMEARAHVQERMRRDAAQGKAE